MANEKRRQRRKLNVAKRQTNKNLKKFHFKTETTSEQKNQFKSYAIAIDYLANRLKAEFTVEDLSSKLTSEEVIDYYNEIFVDKDEIDLEDIREKMGMSREEFAERINKDLDNNFLVDLSNEEDEFEKNYQNILRETILRGYIK